MKFNVITIFPDLISHYCSETILARAQKNKIIKINAIDLRDFAEDKHNKVDDTPYGGGPGMVMKPEPVFRALTKLRALKNTKHPPAMLPARRSCASSVAGGRKALRAGKQQNTKITILLSPRGKQFDQRMAEKLSKMKEITFVCGRYEGVDQRVVDYMVDEEISVGPYVLAGGELAALVIIESISRLIRGVLGNEQSLNEESFGGNFQFPISNFQTNSKSKIQKRELKIENCKLKIVHEYPQYTKPSEFKGWKVPEVLLSGNHGEIEKWRKHVAHNT